MESCSLQERPAKYLAHDHHLRIGTSILHDAPMWRFAVGLCFLSCLAACNQIFGIPEVTQSSRVGGRVRGLWDGTDGVALRLQADGVDTILTTSINGDFHFDTRLVPGASYTATVATNPVRHACIVDGGGSGTANGADITSISVACTGPAVSITLSAATGWSFDPTEEAQTIVGSVIMQDVALTVSSSAVTSASLDGAAVRLGEQTPRIALPLGKKTMGISLAASGGLSRSFQLTFDRGASVLEQLAYGKASNTNPGDAFGELVSLSGDTLAVGASGERSAATGVNGNQADNSAGFSGAVYVFVRSGTSWSQQAYLKASNTGVADQFGWSVSLSGDTLAVGASGEASVATGVNGNQADNGASASGAVYVFVRSGTSWSQQAYLKASNTGAGDGFGGSVSLSGDTLAVGAREEASATIGNQADNSAGDSGAVYVFVRSGASWSQRAYLKASNTDMYDHFGESVSLSGDTLAVGAVGEASLASGVNGNQADNSASASGAVYVFVRSGASWSQQAYLKASNTGAVDFFGGSVSLSGDTLAVGAFGEDSLATGVNGNQADNSASGSGAVYVFVRSGASWSQQAYLKASNTNGDDRFGWSVSLSGDTLAVGAFYEDSAATGVNGNQADNSAADSGAVYLFR
jgi:trimeric autotransporter adhesin